MNQSLTALTVSDLTRRIKQMLESGFGTIVVQGELSNVKLHTSGHLYFIIKDESAQISGVMWRSRVGSLSFIPEDGQKVVATGRITVYEPRGSYQIDCNTVRPLGLGELQAAFERLKQKLAAEGLFAAERKRPLPRYPRRIGIVTSPTGAALHDMLNILGRRWPGVEVVVIPVRVQGAGAAAEIAQGIRDACSISRADLLIVGRGGGSLEDLWAFNEEIVARAIAAATVPVVSAVGHEIDFTIADFVADFRAPTPSAAAELAVPDRMALIESLRTNWYHLRTYMKSMLDSHRRTIDHLLASHALNRPVDLLHRHAQRVDELDRSLAGAVRHSFDLHGARLRELTNRVGALNPDQVLRRGYAIVRKDGKTVSSQTGVDVGETIGVTFHDGQVISRVTGKKP